ncbi:S-layer homology domain-containing protein [Halobacillus litoralis]|uniref:YcdB/YcdC domain-containing protein n=1 Tax=Halobacillus litoralis TaxID=45668 RepID=UPI001CD4A5BE|nr:YcdB/YcdC domain-containing protein [Halobacillus litoralis]MCA0970720.1 S-layer homology domain-containing protein [Halobacillus litoralis]
MKYVKRTGVVTLSTLLSLGVLVPGVSAETSEGEKQEDVKIEILSAEKDVTKEDLVERFKEMFPERYETFKDAEFRLEGRHLYPEEDVVRYGLDFNKQVDGDFLHGSISFVGEELKIDHFYYQPPKESHVLFPEAISKKEAEEAAIEFLEEKLGESGYELEDEQNYYPYRNQALTEPVRYNFSFNKMKDDVPVSDQYVHIEVIGNGEVVQFSRRAAQQGTPTYDDVSKVLSEEEVVNQIKENLKLGLRYDIQRDQETGERSAKLVYQSTMDIRGVDAISGDWKKNDEFVEELPEEKEITMVVDEPLEPTAEDFSKEAAKEQAQELLAVDSEDIELVIESVREHERDGEKIYDVRYMYQYDRGGRGTSIEFDAETGDLRSYRDVKHDLPMDREETDEEITSEEAVEKAVGYLKEYAPSMLHQYAMPVEGPFLEDFDEAYHVSFPRVKNGVLVSGDSMSVRVAKDGSLVHLDARTVKLEEWPSLEDVVPKEEAKESFIDELMVELSYVQDRSTEDNHYDLLYRPFYHEEVGSYFDAKDGEWKNERPQEKEQQTTISHPWAEKELNYLIGADILNVEDPETFDADSAITKGQGIEVIMKSLTHFYNDHYPEERKMPKTFDNIGADHPLYEIVERAAEMGVLTEENDSFPLDEKLTREELAVWYVRALNLDRAAEYSDIYDLDFKDASEVEAENVGYVALADALGLLQGNHNQFNPDGEVTFAQLAVSNIRLAKQAYEEDLRY